MLRFLWVWGPVVGYCTLIFMLSAQHNLAPPQFPSSDKIAHFLEYGMLGLLWARAATRSWPYMPLRPLLLSTVLFTGLYGVTDEWHQLYVPGRSSDWRDAVADVCGGTIGGLSYLVTLRLVTKSAPTDHLRWKDVA